MPTLHWTGKDKVVKHHHEVPFKILQREYVHTDQEGWVYKDNVNNPRIKKWLHQIVGKEGQKLSRHNKWLCMMYPRLKLLHRLLASRIRLAPFFHIDRCPTI